jgi:uncharacterized phage protein gp47/JayE
MPDLLTPAGLTVKSVNEVISDLVTAMLAIYGPDINVAPNSPDGQLINIFAQASVDLRELLLGVANSFSPATAYGTLLDQRVALNGLARKQGTFTLTNVDVTVNQAVTLPGLDAALNDPDGAGFTVKDGAGNQFILAATTYLGSAGTTTLLFRSKVIGAVQTIPNTIVNQAAQVLGVTAVNNPASATAIGVDEETDAQLRTRHARSFALASTGGADAVEAALKAIPSVTDALVVENATTGTVAGTPANSIWAIVTGGTPVEIAQAIYAKKGIGCGMRGALSYVITRPNGTGFTSKWDVSISQRLYIKFTVNPRTAGVTYDHPRIAAALAAALVYKLGQAPTVGDIVSAVLAIEPTAYLTVLGVSTDGTNWFDSVQPTSALYYFTVAVGDITVT